MTEEKTSGASPQWDSAEWQAVAQSAANNAQSLRELLDIEDRTNAFVTQADGIYMDFTRQRLTQESLQQLLALAQSCDVSGKINSMFAGDRINVTEDRAVLHAALRASVDPPADRAPFQLDGVDQVPLVADVLAKIQTFSEAVRNGSVLGQTGQKLVNIVSVGIGGSYLGAEFVANALMTDKAGAAGSEGRNLRFYANVDPLGFARATKGLDPAETLVVVISKTFTTRETLMNAGLLRDWIVNALGQEAVSKHVIAVSAHPERAVQFGINEENVFGFWDWVGGRYSVSSAVGVVPLSLYFGYDVVQEFLRGASSMDEHFRKTDLDKNIPVLLGLLGVWNSTFLGYGTRALISYCESLNRLAAHIQQLDMESNGKRVNVNGAPLPFDAGEIDFGEPGTNAQHSFFQLIHQGRTIPLDLIGFVKSQLGGQPMYGPFTQQVADSHDELMANFFAQADALALGKTEDEVRADGVPEQLVTAKVFTGNRPSTLLIFDELTPFTCGQILAMYEHRTAVQGWIWGINSFDQWGVELGKVLGKKVRKTMQDFRENQQEVDASQYKAATVNALNYYLKRSSAA